MLTGVSPVYLASRWRVSLSVSTRIRLKWLRRRLWLVPVVAVVVMVPAAAMSFGAETTYTGRTVLAVQSGNDVSPRDVSVLADGYIHYFNDPAFQDTLKQKAGIPDDVAVTAQLTATSPLMYVDATASTSAAAQSAANVAGTAFRDEINAQVRAGQDAAIASVRKPYDDILANKGLVPDVTLAQMQQQIDVINASTSSKLLGIQLRAGVAKNDPPILKNLLEALIGGLLLGCVVALVAGAVSRRLESADDIVGKLEVTPLATIPRGGDATADGLRQNAVRHLITRVAVSDRAASAGSTVTALAVASPRYSSGVDQLAREIAEERAKQGVRTVLVDANLHRPGAVGTGEVLTDVEHADLDAVLADTGVPNLRELMAGNISDDPFAVLTAPRLAKLIGRLHEHADLVVLISPPLVDAAEAQVVCATADRSLLVVAKGATTVADARESLSLLEPLDSELIGVVLVDVARDADEPTPVAAKTVAAEPESSELADDGDQPQVTTPSK